MRVAVLPREQAAFVITTAMARGAWGVNAVTLALTIPMLSEYLAVRGLGAALPIPLGILIALIACAIVAAVFPRPWVAATYLVVAAIAAIAFEMLLLTAHPAMLEDGLYILNRPAVVLVLVGAAAASASRGLVWTSLGFIVSNIVTGVVALIASVPFTPGFGALFNLLLCLTAYAALAGIQASQRRRVPNFDELERETQRMAVEESLRTRVTAAVHDTLLNDLSIVMNAPDELDDRVTGRLRQDLHTLTGAAWLTESAEVPVDEQDAVMRNQIMMLVSEMQWRGLTVQVTGNGTGIYRLAPAAATALVEAMRACLENTLRHSGAAAADLDLAYSPEGVTVVISDQGVGFDLASIAPDRLGLRASIIERIRGVGGSARVWSLPGAGTSVVMRIPVVEVVAEHEESTHGHA